MGKLFTKSKLIYKIYPNLYNVCRLSLQIISKGILSCTNREQLKKYHLTCLLYTFMLTVLPKLFLFCLQINTKQYILLSPGKELCLKAV